MTAWGIRPSRTLRVQRARPLNMVTLGRQLSRLTWSRRWVTRDRSRSRPMAQPLICTVRRNLLPVGSRLPTKSLEAGRTSYALRRPSRACRVSRMMEVLPWVVLSEWVVLLTPIRAKSWFVPLTTLVVLSPRVPRQRCRRSPQALRCMCIILRVSPSLKQSLVSRACRAVLARFWPLWVTLTTAPFTPEVWTCPLLENMIYLVARLMEARPCGVSGKVRAREFTRLSTSSTNRLLGMTPRIKLPVGLANRERGRPILTPLERRMNALVFRREGH